MFRRFTLGLAACVAGFAVSVTMGVFAADPPDVKVMPDRFVRPGDEIPVFGNVDNGVDVAPTHIGASYFWTFTFNGTAVTVNGSSSSPLVLSTAPGGLVVDPRYIAETVTFDLINFGPPAVTRSSVFATLTVAGVESARVEIDIIAGLSDAIGPDIVSTPPLDNQAIDVDIAIEDVMRAIYRAQETTTTGPSPFGSWNHVVDNPANNCGTTAFSVWAFAATGHKPTTVNPPNGSHQSIYAFWVQEAIDYILNTQAVVLSPPFPLEPNLTVDFDANGNDFITSLCGPSLFEPVGYASPIAASALLAAYEGDPDLTGPLPPFYTTVHSGGPAGIAGKTIKDIVQDSVDWSAFGQSDTAPGRGGWRYTSNYPTLNALNPAPFAPPGPFPRSPQRSTPCANPDGGGNSFVESCHGDVSVESWHYVAMEGLVELFDGIVLEDVKLEIETRLNNSQCCEDPPASPLSSADSPLFGQFGYTNGRTHSLDLSANATTAGGLSGLGLVTQDSRDAGATGTLVHSGYPNVQPNLEDRKNAAVEYLGKVWNVDPGAWRGNKGNFYAMWTQARALRLSKRPTLNNGGVEFSWETGENQLDLGTVPAEGSHHEGYWPWLVRTQQDDGSWLGGACPEADHLTVSCTFFNDIWDTNLNNAWGLLILQPTVFGKNPCPVVSTSTSAKVKKVKVKKVKVKKVKKVKVKKSATSPTIPGSDPCAPPPECGRGLKVGSLTLTYTGSTTVNIEVSNKKVVATSFPGITSGASFTIAAPPGGTLGSNTTVEIDGGASVDIHTSCSKPLSQGQSFPIPGGGTFVVTVLTLVSK